MVKGVPDADTQLCATECVKLEIEKKGSIVRWNWKIKYIQSFWYEFQGQKPTNAKVIIVSA